MPQAPRLQPPTTRGMEKVKTGLRGAAVGEKNHKAGISELRTLTKLTLLHTECTALRRASKGQCSLSPSAPWASLTSQITSRCEPHWTLQTEKVRRMKTCGWAIPLTLLRPNFKKDVNNAKLEDRDRILPEKPNEKVAPSHVTC